MSSPVRQACFNAGEIAPGLYGRTSLKRYSDALKLARNMFPRQEGPLTNRSGFVYKGAARVDTGAGRIVPFVFSSGTLSNSYVLEFTALKIRFWKNGARIENPPGTPVEVTTDYTDAEISRLKFAQRGQVLYIFCKQKVIRELTWTSDTVWAIADFALTRTLAAPVGVAWTGWAGDSTIAPRSWDVLCTAVDANGIESLPSSYVNHSYAITPNHPATLSCTARVGAVKYNWYRGRNGLFGYVGCSVGTPTFYDDGAAPVYAQTPPTGRDPFSAADDKPQIGTFHDQRLACANAWNNPGEIEMSMVGEAHNFDRRSPPLADDAVTINLASAQYEEIRNLVSYGRALLVMTNAQEQLITGSQGLITQDDIVFDDQPTRWGSSWLDALHIGFMVLFVQDAGSTVREMNPLDKTSGNDLTLLGQHLFLGHTITSWCYAHEPHRLIWAVRDDGALLSCTYVKELDLWAWARHDTGTDTFEWVCSVPETGESAVYALVKRTTGGLVKRYFERLASRVNQALVDGIFFDSAVTYSGAATVTIGGLSHLVSRTVYALADGVQRGPFVVDGAGQITLPVAATKVQVGLQIMAQGQSLDMYSTQEEIRPLRKMIKRVFAEVEDSMPFKAGQRLTDTLETATRADGQDWTALYTGLVQININGDWDDRGSVCWQQDGGSPLTILSLIREVEFGGR